jgi:hypothetical protein
MLPGFHGGEVQTIHGAQAHVCWIHPYITDKTTGIQRCWDLKGSVIWTYLRCHGSFILFFPKVLLGGGGVGGGREREREWVRVCVCLEKERERERLTLVWPCWLVWLSLSVSVVQSVDHGCSLPVPCHVFSSPQKRSVVPSPQFVFATCIFFDNYVTR